MFTLSFDTPIKKNLEVPLNVFTPTSNFILRYIKISLEVPQNKKSSLFLQIGIGIWERFVHYIAGFCIYMCLLISTVVPIL